MSYTSRYSSRYTPDRVFPLGPLDVNAEIQVGGAWTDVSNRIYQRDGKTPIVITRGRQNETSGPTASSATFQVNNRNGDFSLHNPNGAFYGLLRRNTPLRFSVPGQQARVRMEDNSFDTITKVSTPFNAAYSFSASIDIRMELFLSSYHRQVLAAMWSTTGNNRVWALVMHRDGTLGFWWSTDGTFTNTVQVSSTVPIPVERQSIRVTLQKSSGVVTFYTGAQGGTDGSTWTQLGDPVINGATTLFAGTPELGISRAAGVNQDDNTYFSLNGNVYEFELRNSIGGTVVAHPDFTLQTTGTAAFTDATGRTWTCAGDAEISDRRFRYHGEWSAFPTSWTSRGEDVWITASSGGLLRRLGQGNAPLDSPLKRHIMFKTGTLAPVGYWPVEDGQASSSIASALSGAPPMTYQGTPSFAVDSQFVCSNALAQLAGSSWTGVVPYYNSNGSIVIRFLVHITSEPPDATVLLRALCTRTCREFTLRYHTGGNLSLSGWDTNGNNLFDSGSTIPSVLNQLFRVDMNLTPIGSSNVQWELTTAVVGNSSGIVGGVGSFSGDIGNVLQIQVNPNNNTGTVTMGHITIQSDWEGPDTDLDALRAWNFETAGNRFFRLCQEEGVPVRILGYPNLTTPMGPQTSETLTSLLSECEITELGLIYEPKEGLALGLRTLASLQSQSAVLSVNYAAAMVGDTENVIQVTEDDTYIRNNWTVQRTAPLTSTGLQQSGSSFMVVLDDGSSLSISPPAEGGAGNYAYSMTVNTPNDSFLPDIAGWQLNLGTVDGPRYPAIPFNLARPQIAGTSTYWDILNIRDGDYLAITSGPPWLPPGTVKQLAWGWREILGGFYFVISFQCVPEQPYEVATLDDPVLGFVNTDGSSLASPIGPGDAAMSVVSVNPSYPWTTDSANFPQDVIVGGEQVTVASIAAVSGGSQKFTLSARSVNGVVSSHSAGAPVSTAYPIVLAIR